MTEQDMRKRWLPSEDARRMAAFKAGDEAKKIIDVERILQIINGGAHGLFKVQK